VDKNSLVIFPDFFYNTQPDMQWIALKLRKVLMKAQKWMLVLLALSGAVSMQLSSGVAQATEAETKPADLSENVVPVLTDIAKNADGSVLHLNQYDADSYCRNQGQRLPTARELALYAQSLGARGVSDTPKVGYELVNGSDSAGHPDNFYFCYLGYKMPPGGVENNMNSFWSSSVDPDHSNVAIALSGYQGVLVGFDRSFAGMGAVRCVRSR
jgi:hypothetical protein